MLIQKVYQIKAINKFIHYITNTIHIIIILLCSHFIPVEYCKLNQKKFYIKSYFTITLEMELLYLSFEFIL